MVSNASFNSPLGLAKSSDKKSIPELSAKNIGDVFVLFATLIRKSPIFAFAVTKLNSIRNAMQDSNNSTVLSAPENFLFAQLSTIKAIKLPPRGIIKL